MVYSVKVIHAENFPVNKLKMLGFRDYRLNRRRLGQLHCQQRDHRAASHFRARRLGLELNGPAHGIT
jgi:hypothetical protein